MEKLKSLKKVYRKAIRGCAFLSNVVFDAEKSDFFWRCCAEENVSQQIVSRSHSIEI